MSACTKIALLGHGTVGGGVYQKLAGAAPYAVVGCAVKHVHKHDGDIPARLLSGDPFEIVARDADVVVEVIGGLDPARALVREALSRGRHVITANKTLIAECGDELATLARARGVTLSYSAAVGGEVPVLETIDQIRRRSDIARVRGVLSGTANFVLSSLADGVAFKDAIAEAQRLGLAEADPSRDIDGSDVADKLAIVIEHAFSRRVQVSDIARTGIDRVAVGPPKSTLVATATHGGYFTIEPRILAADDPLAGLTGADNRVVIETTGGESTIVSGLGAGRWPTTRAVLADLSRLSRRTGGDA